jgi:hypothetical protein
VGALALDLQRLSLCTASLRALVTSPLHVLVLLVCAHALPLPWTRCGTALSGDALQGLVHAVHAAPSDPAKRCVMGLGTVSSSHSVPSPALGCVGPRGHTLCLLVRCCTPLYDRLELAQALIAAGVPDRAVEHLLVAIKLNKADGAAKETLLKVGWSPAPSGVAWHAHAAVASSWGSRVDVAPWCLYPCRCLRLLALPIPPRLLADDS